MCKCGFDMDLRMHEFIEKCDSFVKSMWFLKVNVYALKVACLPWFVIDLVLFALGLNLYFCMSWFWWTRTG